METKINYIDDADQIEFHYVFDNKEEHTVDAYLKNNCEKEFLGIIKTVSADLSVGLGVTTEPQKEGSFVDVYNFCISQDGTTVVAWGAFFISIIQLIISLKTRNDKEEQKLNIANQKLDLIAKASELKKQGVPIPDDIEQKIEKIYKSHKVIKQKSNLYKKLFSEKKIISVEIVALKKGSNKEKFSVLIPRNSFSEFYLESDDLDSVLDNSARIEIISPVLSKGKYLWRGYYLKEKATHEFKMLDKDFRKSVVDDGIPFKTGTQLECELEICKKLDDNGDEYNSQYKINKVFNTYQDDSVIEMPSGKKRREKREIDDMQKTLF